MENKKCVVCGKEYKVKPHLKEKSKYCSRECMGKSQINDISNKKFGKLTVLKYVGIRKNYAMWLCKCECGNIKEVCGSYLIRGITKSCGCLVSEKNILRSTKHNKSHTRIYAIYRKMKSRCCNKKDAKYKNYGERGILICEEWLDKDIGFTNFYNWAMNNYYSDNLTIDRIDVNGNYEPSNCKWSTLTEQAQNKTTTRYIVYNNKTYTTKELAESLGVSYDCIRKRYFRKNNKNKE